MKIEERQKLKPTIELARATTPNGQPMVLSQHDRDYYITIDQYTLMTSREQESELELARLGCTNLQNEPRPHVLIGGLGMGFTLRETLDLLPPSGKVIVAELMPEVIAWNREHLGVLTDQPLQDSRVTVRNVNVCDLIAASKDRFDAILLDVDNGPSAMTVAENARLYQATGLHWIMRALRGGGCLAIWSVNGDTQFEKRLRRERLSYRLVRVSASRSAKSKSRYIWLITAQPRWLPKAH